jgi:lipid II:glycine glycyltransferase (peptidoglycan interpeptide bridge formation enzyme)
MMRELWTLEPFEEFVGYYDVATPYGYGGIVLKGPWNEGLLDQFYDEMTAYFNERRVVAEFSRLDPVSGNVGLYAGRPYDCADYTKTVRMYLDTPEQVFSDMKSTSRNRIRKALENEVNVTMGYNQSYFDIFREISDETMTRRNARAYYYFSDAFYGSMLEGLKGKAKIYIAWYRELPVSAFLVLYSAGNATYHLGGSASEYMMLGANNLLIFEAAKDLITMGVRTLLLGGGYGGAEDSLLQFKRTLAPSGVLDCHMAKRIFNGKIYDALVEKKKSFRQEASQNNSYFPAYRG